MKIIVITGGLAAGKSTAADFFRSRGAMVIDLDEVASRLLETRDGVRAELESRFPGCLKPDGSVDRAVLASVAFESAASLAALNGIIHPVVAREVEESLRELRLRPDRPDVVVIEVPLLAEVPALAEIADLVIALEAPFDERLARAIVRGFSEADVRRRVALQAPDSARAVLADIVLDTGGEKSRLLERLATLWDEYVVDPDTAGSSR